MTTSIWNTIARAGLIDCTEERPDGTMVTERNGSRIVWGEDHGETGSGPQVGWIATAIDDDGEPGQTWTESRLPSLLVAIRRATA